MGSRGADTFAFVGQQQAFAIGVEGDEAEGMAEHLDELLEVGVENSL